MITSTQMRRLLHRLPRVSLEGLRCATVTPSEGEGVQHLRHERARVVVGAAQQQQQHHLLPLLLPPH